MSLLPPRLQAGQESAFNAQLAGLVAEINSRLLSPILNGQYIRIRSSIAVQEVRHTLGRMPLGFLPVVRPVGVDVGGAISAAWTKDRIYVESDTDDADVTLYVW